MSPQKHSGEISLFQTPPYVIQPQTVWRRYGDGMETHRFSVPADADQDDLITLLCWPGAPHPSGRVPMPRRGERSGMRAGPAAHLDPRRPAVHAVTRPARRQRQRRLIPGNHGSRLLPGHQVVWNWQAVAVVRSDPVRDQENQPAWPLGRPVAWSLKSPS